MQVKLNNTRKKMEDFLSKKNINFTISECEVESDGDKQKNFGYRVETDNLFGTILPNYNNNKVEFLVLNHSLLQHLESEGFSSEEIEKKGKIWIHLTKMADFQKLFVLGEKAQKLN